MKTIRGPRKHNLKIAPKSEQRRTPYSIWLPYYRLVPPLKHLPVRPYPNTIDVQQLIHTILCILRYYA
jgi:hypothetical protein